MPQRRLIGQAVWLLTIGAAATLIVTSVSIREVLAANTWTTTMTVNAVGEAAVMPAGQPPIATVVQGVMSISWGPSILHSGTEVSGYILNRQTLGTTSVVQVCTVSAPMRICQDSPPVGQQVVYLVVPTNELWRGRSSAPSAPVMLSAVPASAALSSTPAASPTPTTSSSAAPTATPSSSPTASPSASATSSATPSPTASSSAAPSPS